MRDLIFFGNVDSACLKVKYLIRMAISMNILTCGYESWALTKL